jgi:hypothetical protein
MINDLLHTIPYPLLQGLYRKFIIFCYYQNVKLNDNEKMRVVFTTVGQDCCPIGASEGNPVKKALVRPETDGRTRAFPLCEIVMKLNPDYFFQTNGTYIRI